MDVKRHISQYVLSVWQGVLVFIHTEVHSGNSLHFGGVSSSFSNKERKNLVDEMGGIPPKPIVIFLKNIICTPDFNGDN